MNKLEVGMYVRTIGGIERLKKENDNGWFFEKSMIIKPDNIEKYIIKASFNITDLIQEGDYLNGFKVSKIERYDTNTIIKIGNSTFNVLEGEKIYTPSYDNNNGYEKIEKLKSIVTKEQFSSMEYRLGGK